MTNPVERDLLSDIISARWRLRRMWSYETAMIDVEMDSQAPDFERRFERYDEDMRGSAAFSALTDKSKGLSTALRYDIHLGRTYRRSLDELRRMRSLRSMRSIGPQPSQGLDPLDYETNPNQNSTTGTAER